MISNKCYYALRAMLELAKQDKHGPVSTSVVAQAQQIPPRFLEAILRQLKQAGLARSLRGKEGGYQLVSNPSEVTMGQIIRLFEGPLVDSPVKIEGEPDVLATVWKQADEALSSIYDTVTLRDLVERDRELRMKNINDYTI